MSEYTVVIERSEHNFGAWVPDLDGCVATGVTLDEVTTNIREAIEFHLEGMLLNGEAVPPPSSSIVTTNGPPRGARLSSTTIFVLGGLNDTALSMTLRNTWP